MSSSDSGDQASARGMSLLLLIHPSLPIAGFFSRAFIFVNFVKMLCTSAHTYICTAVVLVPSSPTPGEFHTLSLHVFITSHIDKNFHIHFSVGYWIPLKLNECDVK